MMMMSRCNLHPHDQIIEKTEYKYGKKSIGETIYNNQ
jgi:hypothetical protein